MTAIKTATRISRIESASALLKEIGAAADQSTDDNGRVKYAELNGMIRNEGYRRGEPIADAPRAVHRYAQNIAQRTDPRIHDFETGVDRALGAIRKAAARDGKPGTLSPTEYATLSPTAKAVVAFGKKYGPDHTLDEFFF